jgi:lipopolysaccharide transport system permease protein
VTGAVPLAPRRRLAAIDLGAQYWTLRARLFSAALHEFNQRYRGSLLGLAWVVLLPTLFLGVYAFVYLAVFRVSLPEGGPEDYALYVLAGLAPYFATMEVVGQSANALRSNLAQVRNAVLPLEAIPARIALVALIGELAAMALLLVLAAWTGRLTANVLLLPLVLAAHFAFNLGLALTMVAVGALVRDVAHVANLFMMLLLFVSPIAFTESMLPDGLRFLADFNPVFYLAQAFREALFRTGAPDWTALAIFACIAAAAFVFGAAVLRRFRTYVMDNA